MRWIGTGEKNFAFTHNGKEYWYSRSIVCSIFVYAKYKGDWYIAVAQRGDNQTSPRAWNVPGGFLDHNETLDECALRELFEEMGLYLYATPKLYKISENKGGKQHVIFSWYINMGEVKELPELSQEHNEPGETLAIEWMKVKDSHTRHWINSHNVLMEKILKERINISWLQKLRDRFHPQGNNVII